MRKFKIGEVARLLNTPVETIRFLEKQGLVTPEKDAANGYRSYTIWNINQILEYKKYRQIGFSSKETVALVKSSDLRTLIDKLEDKRKDAAYLAHYYRAKALKLRNFQEVLQSAVKFTGKYFIINRPENYSLFFGSFDRQMLRVIDAKETEGAFDELISQHPFMEQAFCLSFSSLTDSAANPEVKWGFTIKKRWADRLNLKLHPQMQHFGSVPCLVTFIRVGQKQYVTFDLLQGIFAYMREQNYELNGDIFLIYQATVCEDGENIRYMEAWVPIKAAPEHRLPPSAKSDIYQSLERVYS